MDWSKRAKVEGTPANSDAKTRQAYQAVFKPFRSGSLKVYTPLSLVLGILIAYPLFERWEEALFYLFGPAAGAVDPVYGKDIGSYLFSLPVYSFLQRPLMLAFLILLVSMIFLYWLEHRLLAKQEERLPRGAKIHLSALILINFAIEIWNFILQRYELLYTSSHSLFFGPGFVEMWVISPLIWLSLLLLAGTALSLVYSFNSRKRTRAARCARGRFCTGSGSSLFALPARSRRKIGRQTQ